MSLRRTGPAVQELRDVITDANEGRGSTCRSSSRKVSGPEEGGADRVPLDGVAVEHLLPSSGERARASIKQVVRVLDARVHPLPAAGVDVRGVAGEEDAALAVAVDLAAWI